MIRVIAGKWRRRRITVPDLPGVRPTSDRVKETAFNWIAQDVVDVHCLDAFAGSGGLGIEALSRGAASVQFIDASRQVCQHLQATLALFDAQNQAQVHHARAPWTGLMLPEEGFSIVFLDPPFAHAANLLALTLEWLLQPGMLASQAQIYFEAPRRMDLTIPSGFKCDRKEKGGQVQYGLLILDDL